MQLVRQCYLNTPKKQKQGRSNRYDPLASSRRC